MSCGPVVDLKCVEAGQCAVPLRSAPFKCTGAACRAVLGSFTHFSLHACRDAWRAACGEAMFIRPPSLHVHPASCASAGLYEEALDVLQAREDSPSPGTAPLLHYYRTYLHHLLGKVGSMMMVWVAHAEPSTPQCCFTFQT